jgi:hypothetical protein
MGAYHPCHLRFSQTAAGSAAVSALASLVTEKILKGRAEIGIGRWGNAGKGLGEMMKIWLIMVNTDHSFWLIMVNHDHLFWLIMVNNDHSW